MERIYYKRNRRIVVEEIPDIRAVHLSVNERGETRVNEESLGTSAIETIRSNTSIEFPEEAVTAFEQANWRFIHPSAETSRSLPVGENLRGAEEVGKVIRRADGSLAVATNRLNVQLRSDLSENACQAILAEKRLEVLTKLRFAPNLYEVIAQGREDALAASVELHEDSRFTLAEPSLTEYIPQRFTPTDPRYTDQWQWHNTGQGGGTVGADVSAEEAWDFTRGAGIRVAVIDNGFDADHEDLVAGVSGMSGYFSSGIPGNTTFIQGTVGMPDSNHGTFCAGILGARHNDGHGGCGAAPECDLMLIAALNDQVGTQTTLARTVAYASDPTTEVGSATVADGADILVCSLGPNGAVWALTVVLELALEFAAVNGRNGRGLAIFWAASNGNNVDVTLDEVVSHEDVIAVVRSNRNDLEDNAARGRTVELIAPGVNVFSTNSGNGYGTSTGTSFAAPCAAGCAALALSRNPNLTRNELRQIMRDTADKIGGVVYDANGHNDDYGFGRVNAHQAVLRAVNSISSLAQAM
jgi:thermitase